MKKIIISRQSEKKKRGKWYYIMLGITVLTVGAVAILTRNTANKILNQNIKMSETSVEKALTNEENEPQLKVITDEKKVIPASAKEIDSQKKLELIPPVVGNVIKEHNNTEPEYSKTPGDWRIHKGVDIACPMGTQVVSCEDGNVDAVYLDDRLGYTVIIKHDNDVRTKYANLDAEIDVNVGQAVKIGDKIGIVGDTSEFEIADEAHLHFEVMRGEENVSPDLFIKGY